MSAPLDIRNTVSRCTDFAPSSHFTLKAIYPTQDFHITQNSELNPKLVSVLTIESNTGVEASIFHSYLADEQRAIRLHLVSWDQTQSVGSSPRRPGLGQEKQGGRDERLSRKI